MISLIAAINMRGVAQSLATNASMFYAAAGSTILRSVCHVLTSHAACRLRCYA
jgi:hypothetical protein